MVWNVAYSQNGPLSEMLVAHNCQLAVDILHLLPANADSLVEIPSSYPRRRLQNGYRKDQRFQ